MSQEQRFTERLTKYWQQIRRDQAFPDIKQFNTSTVEDVWPYCFRVSVNKSGADSFKYEYMGTLLVDLYGNDLTGITINYNMREIPGSVIHKRLQEVAESAAPAQDEGHYINKKGKSIKYRACVLPFGNPREGMTHIVVCMSYRAF
jgi:hypothetical protein